MRACDAALMKLPSAPAGGSLFHALTVGPDQGKDGRMAGRVYLNFIDIACGRNALWPSGGGSGPEWRRFADFRKRLKISSLFRPAFFRLPRSMAPDAPEDSYGQSAGVLWVICRPHSAVQEHSCGPSGAMLWSVRKIAPGGPEDSFGRRRMPVRLPRGCLPLSGKPFSVVE